ncbi:MAG: DUF6273 domain-containing protein [Spirochaetaceae bacterium]|jgi:hypothetical protein|nr:DUF6273 domain-containing protein [Spirochaetaceae bacterium]
MKTRKILSLICLFIVAAIIVLGSCEVSSGVDHGGGGGSGGGSASGIPPTSIIERLGIKTGVLSGAAKVRTVFYDLSNYLEENPAAPDIVLGDWVDLASLTVEDYEGDGAISIGFNKDLSDHGTLLRLIVVGKNSFHSGKGVGGAYNIEANDATPHLVFQFQNIPGTRRMEAANTNSNGYIGSEMQTYLVGAGANANKGTEGFLKGLIAAGVPEDIIFAPTRYIANKGEGANRTVADKLWLPTEMEIFGGRYFSNSEWEKNTEQARLEYYSDNNRRVKYPEEPTLSGEPYWLASPFSSNSTSFCSVDSSGKSGDNGNATSEYGVAPAFCVTLKK